MKDKQQLPERNFEKVKFSELQVGDFINVNTGYRIGDDEDCEILKITTEVGLFGDPQLIFLIASPSFGDHDYVVSRFRNAEQTEEYYADRLTFNQKETK